MYTAFKRGAFPTGTGIPSACIARSRYVITLPGSVVTPVTENCSTLNILTSRISTKYF
jgi:hypothetical protein